jgi:sugar lactone lactonase YvrE
MRRLLVLVVVPLAFACSMKPRSSGEIEGSIRQITQALAQQPDDASLIYILATLHDRAGNANEVIEGLNRLDQLGWNRGVRADDFRKTGKSSAFRAAADRLNARVPRINHAAVAFTIDGQRDLIPEGIAYDPVDDVFYLSSIHRRKVLRVDRHGAARDFVAEAQDGMGSSLGMKVDPKRRLLWVVADASESMRDYTAAQKGRASLFGYDLGDGHLVWKLNIGSPDQPAMLNDLALTSDGTVFITDMQAGRVLRVAPGSQTLEPWIDGLQYPNGIAVSDDDRHVYVADFRGIVRVSVADKAQQRLESQEPLGGIDGLSFRGGSLIGIQNAAGAPRVIRIHLGESNRVEILESDNPQFDLPTTGAIAGNDYYFIANSQIRAFNDDNSIWPEERLKSPVMLRIGL